MLKKLQVIFIFIFLTSMVFTILQSLPIFENTSLAKCSLVKKVLNDSSENDSDSNEDDNSDEDGTKDFCVQHLFELKKLSLYNSKYYHEDSDFSNEYLEISFRPPKI